MSTILEQIKQGNEQLAKLSITDFLDKGLPVEAAITNVGSSPTAETYASTNKNLTPMEQALAQFRNGESPESAIDLMTKVRGLSGIDTGPSGHSLS